MKKFEKKSAGSLERLRIRSGIYASAVTVLVLGLVGAGLLTLQRAVPVVFGANIGTTVTAQLLAFKSLLLSSVNS